MKFPLTTMLLNGHDKYVDMVISGMPLGITPWWFDVENVLTSLSIRESVNQCR